MSFIGQHHFVAIATLWAWLLPFEGPLFLPAQKTNRRRSVGRRGLWCSSSFSAGLAAATSDRDQPKVNKASVVGSGITVPPNESLKVATTIPVSTSRTLQVPVAPVGRTTLLINIEVELEMFRPRIPAL